MTNNTVTTLTDLSDIKTDLENLSKKEKEAIKQFNQVLNAKGPICSHKMYEFLNEFIDIVSQTQCSFTISSPNWYFKIDDNGLYNIQYYGYEVTLKADYEEIYIKGEPIYQGNFLSDMIRDWDKFSQKLIDTASSYMLEKIFKSDKIISSYRRKIERIINFNKE